MKNELKIAIAKIVCGPPEQLSIGTAFLFAEKYVLTALHVVGDRAKLMDGENIFFHPINLTFHGSLSSVSANVVDGCWDVIDDWCVLEIQSCPADTVPIPIASLSDGMKPNFESYGFPVEHGSLAIGGSIRDIAGHYFDSDVMQLFSEEAAAGVGSPLNGLSGAPVLVGGYAVGVIRAHPVRKDNFGGSQLATVKNGTIYASLISKISRVCPNIVMPISKRLDKGGLERALQISETRSSILNYGTSLNRLINTLPYDLPITDFERKALYQDIPGVWAISENELITDKSSTLLSLALGVKRVVVVDGPAGAGKTSMLYSVATQYWANPDKDLKGGVSLPIYCRLRDLAQSTGNALSDRLRQAINAMPDLALSGDGIPSDFLTSWPECIGAKILLLFDGFDEVPVRSRIDLITWMTAAMDEFPELSIIVTVRDAALLDNTMLSARKGRAAIIRLIPPEKNQVQEIASFWLGSGAKDFVDRMDEAGLHEVIETPLGVALSSAVYADKKVIPESRFELYENYISIALANATRRGMAVHTDLSIPYVISLFTLVAKLQSERRELNESNIAFFVSQAIAELSPGLSSIALEARAETVYSNLRDFSGLLTAAGVWKHATFQDFFTAKWYAKTLPIGSIGALSLEDKVLRTQWHGVTMFLFSAWRKQARNMRATELQVFRPIFETFLGTSKEAGRLGFLKMIFAFFKRKSSTIVSSNQAVTKEDILFGVEALIELGYAPNDVEERALELLLVSRSDIADQFKNLCALLFSTGGIDEKILLERWSSQGRLALHLMPWVKQWNKQILEDKSAHKNIEITGLFGLIICCKHEATIKQMIVEKELTSWRCVDVLHAVRYSRRKSLKLDELGYLALKLISIHIRENEELRLEMFRTMGVLNDSNRVRSKPYKRNAANRFANRLELANRVHQLIQVCVKDGIAASEFLSKLSKLPGLTQDDHADLEELMQSLEMVTRCSFTGATASFTEGELSAIQQEKDRHSKETLAAISWFRSFSIEERKQSPADLFILTVKRKLVSEDDLIELLKSGFELASNESKSLYLSDLKRGDFEYKNVVNFAVEPSDELRSFFLHFCDSKSFDEDIRSDFRVALSRPRDQLDTEVVPPASLNIEQDAVVDSDQAVLDLGEAFINKDAGSYGDKKIEKMLFSNGMLCPLSGIHTYDIEKKLCLSALNGFSNKRAVIIIPILNSGHIYVQANLRWDNDDEFDFKMAGEFSKFKNQGVLSGMFESKEIEKIIVSEKKLFDDMKSHPAFKKFRRKMVFIDVKLPYEEKDVVWS